MKLDSSMIPGQRNWIEGGHAIGKNDNEGRDPEDEAEGKAKVPRLQQSTFLCV